MIVNDGKHYDLDKDIKIDGNREYSSDACTFVSKIDNINKASAISVSLISKSGGVLSFISCAEACRQLGISSSIMSKLLNGKAKTAKGWRLNV